MSELSSPLPATNKREAARARTARLLLIENDVVIREAVTADLTQRGYSVTTAADGASALEAFRSGRLDLVLLDLSLPDIDALALLAAIRTARPRLPVIALTDGAELSEIDAFASGADDCLTRSTSLDKLAAHIQARLRWREEGGTRIAVGPLTLHLASNRATLAEKSVLLSPREASLLATFARHAGELLSREELLRLVWEVEFEPGSNIVEACVAALRRKLGPDTIETVRGRGYRLRVSALGTTQSASAGAT
jgi:DNA-binding response OmpR family regulator